MASTRTARKPTESTSIGTKAATTRNAVAGPSKAAAGNARSRTAVPSRKVAGGEEELAKDLDRILKVSKPKQSSVEPIKNAAGRNVSARSASASKAPNAEKGLKAEPPTRSRIAPASKSILDKSKARVGATARTESPQEVLSRGPVAARPATGAKVESKLANKANSSRLTAPANQAGPSSSRRIVQIMDHLQEELPWTTASSSMKATDRARAAMSAISSSSKALGSAIQAGFKYASTSSGKASQGKGKARVSSRPSSSETSSISGKVPGEEVWNDEKVDRELAVCFLALRVFREEEVDRVLGSKGIEVDKACQSVIARCLALNQDEIALDQLEQGRSFLLRRYTDTSSNLESLAKNPCSGTLLDRCLRLLRLPLMDDTSNTSPTIRLVIAQYLIHAWTVVLSQADIVTHDIVSLLPLPDPRKGIELNHPLHLSLGIPITSISSSLFALYRQCLTMTCKDSTQWLHTRRLGLCVLSTLISTSAPASKSTAQQLWEKSLQLMTQYQDKHRNDDSARSCIEAIAHLISWVELILKIRDEDREKWFSGKAWHDLLDFALSAARQLKDSDQIDHFLSLMTGSTSISSSSMTPARQAATPARFDRNAGTKGKGRADSQEPEVMRLCADLARVEVAVQAYIDKSDDLTAASAESALKSVDLVSLSEALLSLSDDDDSDKLLGKSTRAIERIRRLCARHIERDNKATTLNSQMNLCTAMKSLLVSAVDYTEDILQGPLDLSKYGSDLVSGAIDSLLTLSKAPDPGNSSSHLSLAYLERGQRICSLASQCASWGDRSDWMRCIASMAYNGAAKLYKQDNWKNALLFASTSCSWSQEALEIRSSHDEQKEETSESEKDQEVWKSFAASLPRKFELVAACESKMSNYQGTFDAYCQAVAYQPLEVLDQIAMDTAKKSIQAVFDGAGELSALLSRLSTLLLNQPECLAGRLEDVFARMHDREVSPATRGAIGEKLFAQLETGQSKLEVASLMMELGDLTLAVYDKGSHPVRHARTGLRMMILISQTGVMRQRFSEMADNVNHLSDQNLEFAEDSSLAVFIPEYLATSSILRALHQYHSVSEPTVAVSTMAQSAMDQLRSLIIPPTTPSRAPIESDAATKKPLGRARTTTTKRPVVTKAKSAAVSRTVSESKVDKSPARTVKSTASKPRPSETRPQLDDPVRLATLLGSLSSLLGVLGLVFQKVECLKILRALLRGRSVAIDEYVSRSSELAIEYLKLGKHTRANTVFTQALRYVKESDQEVSLDSRITLHLRYSIFLASTNQQDKATEEYTLANRLEKAIPPSAAGPRGQAVIKRASTLERAAISRQAVAAIATARGDSSTSCEMLISVFRLYSRAADVACRFATDIPDSITSEEKQDADPFTAPGKKENGVSQEQDKGADQPAKDDEAKKFNLSDTLATKYLAGLPWRMAEGVLNAALDYATMMSSRGSVKECEYFLGVASKIAISLRSTVLQSRIASKWAELFYRLNRYEESDAKIQEALDLLPIAEGPDGVEIKKVRGDMLSRKALVKEAGDIFNTASKEVQGLDVVFTASEALIPSPKKPGLLSPRKVTQVSPRMKTSGGKSSLSGSMTKHKEPLLPIALAHVLRQQVWLLRQAGSLEASDKLLSQLQALASIYNLQADDYHLNGRIGLLEAFSHFKTDLWMSSLTESTIAMPMGSSSNRNRDRQSTRDSIQIILDKSQSAFLSALALSADGGRVEDVRNACLSLALLRAFQTSLGEGSEVITAAAAEVLAASPAITIHRELLEAIREKVQTGPQDDINWPPIHDLLHLTDNQDDGTQRQTIHHDAPSSPLPNGAGTAEPLSLTSPRKAHDDTPYRSYWNSVKSRYSSSGFLTINQDELDKLPHEWAVISINVTEDKNTMFISRHQAHRQPLVFSLPLDRQGRREGEAEEDLFTFDIALNEMSSIIQESNDSARNAKNVDTQAGRAEWWDLRKSLDKRLEELLANMEFCWLGAFKTILSPPSALDQAILDTFRTKLDRVFQSAIAGKPRASLVKPKQIHLDDVLLECFATLSSKCKDEEAEDLVYFILDIYQFHGVPVALAELDIDQLAIDLKSALAELESLSSRSATPSSSPEHIFLALDKNVAGFPWESIPILRGRSVSRIPSLPFLLHQYSMVSLLNLPTSTYTPPQSSLQASKSGSKNGNSGDSEDYSGTKRFVDARKVFYVLNPSGDLTRTQTHFEPWLRDMGCKAGWKGIVGRQPTELELEEALREYDLVLYFGHGGAEQYIHSHKIRSLTRCATTMLWGCSSGKLRDQGDFDRNGTAWDYMIAGCPSLVAALWDVTDKDIDRLSEEAFRKLQLDPAHVHLPSQKGKSTSGQTALSLLPLSDVSTAEAVARSRDECRLKYLTGAAPVVYGMPVWLR